MGFNSSDVELIFIFFCLERMENMKTRYYRVLAFIFIFVWIEFGAAILNIYCMDAKAYDKKKIIFEPIPIIEETKENNKQVLDETMDDSVDVIAEYMDHYIFLPVVDNMEWKTKEERRKKNERLNSYEMDEKEILYKIVWKESRNQGLDGMRRVCDVVLNRVDDPRFPNNIKDVILAPGQFTTASKLSSVVYDEETIKAVDMELSASKENRLDNESIYFARSPHTKNNYKFGDHYFSH